DTWRSWAPHLIWMDKRMPDLDGLEVTRRIRAEESSRGTGHVAILALSASALDHERGEILAAGCDDFVAKPYQEETIFAKLREWLGVSYVYEERASVRDPVREPVSGSGAARAAAPGLPGPLPPTPRPSG